MVQFHLYTWIYTVYIVYLIYLSMLEQATILSLKLEFENMVMSMLIGNPAYLPKSDELTIPELGIAVVQVIDRVEIHVFCVPGKRRLPHAEIKVGCVDTIDFDLVKVREKKSAMT